MSKIVLPDGTPAPSTQEGPPEDLLAMQESWLVIDTIIDEARKQAGDGWMELLAKRRVQLILSLLPAGAQVWRIFLGEVAPDPKRQGGAMLLRLLGDAAIQILIQFRVDMREGEMLAQQVMKDREAQASEPKSEEGAK